MKVAAVFQPGCWCAQTKYWLDKGKEGFLVYKYLLQRRPNQGDPITSRVEFGGKSVPKGLSALTRQGVYDVDISCGKEPKPVGPFLISSSFCCLKVLCALGRTAGTKGH